MTSVMPPARIRTCTVPRSLYTPSDSGPIPAPSYHSIAARGLNTKVTKTYPERDSNSHDHQGPAASNATASAISATRAQSASDPTAGVYFCDASFGYQRPSRFSIRCFFLSRIRAVRHVRSRAFLSASGVWEKTNRTISDPRFPGCAAMASITISLAVRLFPLLGGERVGGKREISWTKDRRADAGFLAAARICATASSQPL